MKEPSMLGKKITAIALWAVMTIGVGVNVFSMNNSFIKASAEGTGGPFYLVGSMNGWSLENTDYELESIGGSLYQFVGTLAENTEFKLNTSTGWEGVLNYTHLSGSCKFDGVLEEVWYEQGGSGSGVWVTDHNIRAKGEIEMRLTYNSVTGAFTGEPDDTKRVWLDTTGLGWWENDSSTTAVGVYFWVSGGSLPCHWAGDDMTKDNANGLWYYDVYSSVTHVKFTRINKASRSEAFNQSIDVELPANPNTSKYVLSAETSGTEQVGGSVGFSPVAPTVVINFAATIDTQAEACSASSAEAAVGAYLCLPTYEQNAFNSYLFGTPAKTGAETLAYLVTYYGIGGESDPLSGNLLGIATSRDIAIILIVSAFGLASFVGLYLIIRKRKARQF